MLQKGEFAKQLTRFNLVLIISLLLLNLGITAYQLRSEFTSDGRTIRDTEEYYLDLYFSQPDEYESLRADYESRLEAYNLQLRRSLLSGGRTWPVFENKLIDLEAYGDEKLFGELESIINAPDDYRRSIATLLRDSVLRLKDINSSDAYLYRYYTNMIRAYDPLTELELPVTQVRGWNEFFSLRTSTIFIVIISLALFSQVYTLERRCGMNCILHICKRGQLSLKSAKLAYVVISTVFIAIVFTLSPLLVIGAATGLSPLNLPIQLLDMFTYCRFELTIGQYLLIYLAVRALIFVCLGLAASLLGRICGKEAPVYAAAAVLIGAGILLGSIEPTSNYYFLQKFSVSELAEVSILFESYRGLNIFNLCVDYTAFTLILISIVTAALCLVLLATGSKAGSRREAVSIAERGGKATLSLTRTECYKQLICRSGLLVILAAMLLRCVIAAVYYRSDIMGFEQIYRDYILSVAGPITDEKLAYIEDESNYIRQILGEYDEMSSKHRSGELTSEEYQTYMGKYNYAQFCRSACNKLIERRDYLLKLDGEYDSIEFVYEAGVLKLLNAPADYVLALTVLFICGGIFSMEYDSGFSRILRLTRQGRSKLYKTKLIWALSFSAALYLLFGLIDFAAMQINYSADYFSAGIMSLPDFSLTGLNISIGGYIAAYKLIGLVGCICCAAIIIGISLLLKNQTGTLIVAGSIILIPAAADSLGLSLFDCVSVTKFMTPVYINKGVPTYIVCALAAFILLLISHLIWNGGNKPHEAFNKRGLKKLRSQ